MAVRAARRHCPHFLLRTLPSKSSCPAGCGMRLLRKCEACARGRVRQRASRACWKGEGGAQRVRGTPAPAARARTHTLAAPRAPQVAALPADYRALCSSGLHSFLAIPIATDNEVLGALNIAKEGADGFEVDWWVWGGAMGQGRGGLVGGQGRGRGQGAGAAGLQRAATRACARAARHGTHAHARTVRIILMRAPTRAGGSPCWAACPWACCRRCATSRRSTCAAS